MSCQKSFINLLRHKNFALCNVRAIHNDSANFTQVKSIKVRNADFT